MAATRLRAVAVAVGVPVAFGLAAALLTVGATAQAGGTATSAAEGSLTPSGAPTPDPTAASASAAPERTADARPPLRRLPVVYRVDTDDPVVFITIDDGITKDRAGLRLVEERRLPITAFLTAWTIKDDAEYFTRITRWGSIGNHSATHASFAESSTDLGHEICYTQRMLTREFGEEPWLLRPPYGAGPKRAKVHRTAVRCGISDIVMWNALVDKGRLTKPGGRLEAGDIVLLHFTPNLEQDLRTVLRAARKAGLQVANLADYLAESSAGSAPMDPGSVLPENADGTLPEGSNAYRSEGAGA